MIGNYIRRFLTFEKGSRKVMVLGSGRSGTTWVGSVIAKVCGLGQVFEPFIPSGNIESPDFPAIYQKNFVAPQDGKVLHSCPFICNENSNSKKKEKFTKALKEVLYGNPFSVWTNKETTPGIKRGRLVKDIRINCAAKYVARHFPEVKIIFLLRSPFECVASQLFMNHKGWKFDFDVECFLSQSETKFLLEKRIRDSLLELSNNLVERLAFKWCIENFVPFSEEMENEENVLVVYYNRLKEEPEDAWTKVFRFLLNDETEAAKLFLQAKKLLNKPSSTHSGVAQKEREMILKKLGYSVQKIESVLYCFIRAYPEVFEKSIKPAMI